MSKKLRIPYVALALLLFMALACNLSGGATAVSPATEAAQTVNAVLTASAAAPIESASATSPAPTGGVPPTLAPDQPTEVIAQQKPTDTPAPTNTPGAQGCVDGAQYVADVTVPDNAVFNPGAAFTKTWRLKNSGTCTWVGSYTWAFVGGDAMSGPASVPVVGNVAPGSQYDVSVNLVAPATPGTYKGIWQMRNSSAAFFGTKPFVQIVVPAATPTSTATLVPVTITPTATLSAGVWSGAWDTNCGASACAQMNLVQTGNTVVGTYAGGDGTINGTVTGNRLTGTWSRNASSGSIDFWIKAGGLRWQGNFDKTFPWCGQRSGQSAPSPCGVATWYGTWTTVCGDAGLGLCDDITLAQNGSSVSGTYAGGDGSIDATVDGVELTGTWTRSPGTGSFKFFMTPDGLQFQGNYDTANQWCGYRSGSSEPSPCLKN